MQIQCPMNKNFEAGLDELASLGADEFYLGYASNTELSNAILNLRSPCHANFPSLESAADAVRKIKKLGKKSFITINGPFYPPDFEPLIVRDASLLMAAGADGFVVADINIFLLLAENFPDIFLVVSSGGHVMNGGAVDFYKSLGCRRVILSRQLRPAEIKTIAASFPGMEFEIFIMNEECAFLEGYCSYSHFAELDNRAACNAMFSGSGRLSHGKTELFSCGSCSLYELKDLHSMSLKICGRTLQYEVIKKDVVYLKKILGLLGEASSRDAFIAQCREIHGEIFNMPCGEKCYYELRI